MIIDKVATFSEKSGKYQGIYLLKIGGTPKRYPKKEVAVTEKKNPIT